MKRNFKIYKNGYWMSEDINSNESWQHDAATSKEDVITELINTYPGDEIIIDGTPVNEVEVRTLDKKQFRQIVLDNSNQAGKMIEIGDTTYNQGRIYPAKGSSFCYLGVDAGTKTVDYLWKKAKKAGMVVYCNECYYV